MPPRQVAVRRRVTLLAGLFVLVVLGTGTAVPWFDTSLEYKVKAACMFNFARFVEWPKSSFAKDDSPIVFAVVGEDPFGKILDATLKGKTIGGRKTVIERYRDVWEIKSPHILYVSESQQKALPGIFRKLDHKHTLTVSDIDDFAQLGGVAHFYLKSGRVAFEINLDKADELKLVISSQLLKLARVLHDPPATDEGDR